MKNNKGFSLVELIIVIAIMAILVGVMAPQLIKYIEKSKVSSDTQLLATVQTAIVTSMMDPEVLNDKSASQKITSYASGVHGVAEIQAGNSIFDSSVLEILGVNSGADVNGSLKSNNASSVSFQMVNGNSVSLWIPGTDSRGSKSTSGYDIVVK